MESIGYAAADASEKKQVALATQELKKAIAELQDSIADLERALDVVLLPDSSETNVKDNEMKSDILCPLAANMKQDIAEIKATIAKVRKIRARLQV